MGDDPYGCAALRDAVLAGWRRTPSRFREDANAEQDAAGPGYGDRLVVELAQNAADAAGSDGRLLFAFRPDGLLVANSGAPLTASGVLALSTLRASRKGVGEVGRFGVGFAAVLAVSDAPVIGSRGLPSVCWSAARSAELVADISELAVDVAERGGHVPVLRLPFAGPPLDIPDGYDSAVWLPFRNTDAEALAGRLVEAADPLLLLGLPALREVVYDAGAPRRTTCERSGSAVVLDGSRWRVVDGADGIRAYAPDDDGGWPAGAPAVLRAPTPTDEPLSLPIAVIALLPLEPTRRRVVRGAAATRVLRAAAAAAADLAALVADPYPLVPTGFAAGDLDAAFRDELGALLRTRPLFDGLVPERCCLADLGDAADGAHAVLSAEVAGLLPPIWARPERRAAADALGIRRLTTADVVGLLAGRDREPAAWRQVCAGLERAPDRDALAALPVPLLDGRTVTGVRGALLASDDLPAEVAALPVRVVHPDAAHPLLERLGAIPATAASLLADPAVAQAVDDDPDADTTRAVVALAVAGGAGRDTHPWLADLPLPAVGGDLVAAGDLLWPGGLMAGLVDPAAGFAVVEPPEWLDRDAAVRIGVLDRPRLVRRDLVVLDGSFAEDDDELAALDGIEEWASERRGEGPELRDFVAVGDLDALGDPGRFLAVCAAEPELRAAVADPRGRTYTGWWLSRQPVLDGLLPTEYVVDPAGLEGVYARAPASFDAELLRSVGVWSGLEEILRSAEGTGDLLDRLGDAERAPSRATVRGLHAALAGAWVHRLDEAPEPPLTVRAVDGHGQLVVVPGDRAVALESPEQAQAAWAAGLAVVPAPASVAGVVAELLDVRLGRDLGLSDPHGGVETPVPAGVLELITGAPASYRRHSTQAALGNAWRWCAGVLHATDAGLADGLAWAAGAWATRGLVATALDGPESLAQVALETDLEG